MVDTCSGSVGLVMSVICTSDRTASAYVLADMSWTAISCRIRRLLVVDDMTAKDNGAAGSVMFITCTPSYPATTAYVLFDMSWMAMLSTVSKTAKPSMSSVTGATGIGSA